MPGRQRLERDDPPAQDGGDVLPHASMLLLTALGRPGRSRSSRDARARRRELRGAQAPASAPSALASPSPGPPEDAWDATECGAAFGSAPVGSAPVGFAPVGFAPGSGS